VSYQRTLDGVDTIVQNELSSTQYLSRRVAMKTFVDAVGSYFPNWMSSWRLRTSHVPMRMPALSSRRIFSMTSVDSGPFKSVADHVR
jgi:hypothetical protein